MAATTAKPKSALESILEWSVKRPQWQRDALRRVVLGEAVDDFALTELAELSKQPHGMASAAGKLLTPLPLDATHIPSGSSAGDSISLVSIGGLQHVNRLPASQTLTFGGAPGLTVIYGDNGCGKSGYARVIKKACRSRGSAPNIRPNVYNAKPAASASGTITFTSSGTSVCAAWEDGKLSDVKLTNVFVFDSNTAGNYLDEDGPACFTPGGLDVLPKLSAICDAVRQRLNDERSKLTTLNTATSKVWMFNATTTTGKVVASLNANTDPTAVDSLAQFGDTHEQRLKDLDAALASNPKQKARDTRSSAARLRTLSASMKKSVLALDEKSVASIKAVIAEAAQAKQDAADLATKTFATGFLPSTGGALWRALWEAARSYFPEANPTHTFPLTGDDLRCLLCQQPMTEDTRTRLANFEKFCIDTTQQRANELAAEVAKRRKEMTSLPLLDEVFKQADSDLAAGPTGLRAAVEQFVRKADAALKTVRANLNSPTWANTDSLPQTPEPEVEALAEVLDERAKTEDAADDPSLRAKLVAERAELQDQRHLSQVKADVLAQIERHKAINAIEACIKDCATNSITTLNGELSETLINKQYRDQFAAELAGIGLHTIKVQLQDIKGHKGSTTFGLRIVNAADHQVRHVASEGEQRCLALAAFLAELALASHHSTLVFDDPVSSLDFNHCRGISVRLADEALRRQVIVFTHNVVFLNDLRVAAEAKSVAHEFRCVEWEGASPGACRVGLPWEMEKPLERLNGIEQDCIALNKVWNAIPNDDNRRDMARLYGRLRATIERIVEVIVIDGTVVRFTAYIRVANLKALIGFTKAEYDGLYDLFMKASNLIEGHDPAAGGPPAMPSPKDLRTDIDGLRTLINTIKARKAANG